VPVLFSVRAGYLSIVSICIPDFTGFIPNISAAEVQTRLPRISSFCDRRIGGFGIGPKAFRAAPEEYRGSGENFVGWVFGKLN
jgi:hypothetical protein